MDFSRDAVLSRLLGRLPDQEVPGGPAGPAPPGTPGPIGTPGGVRGQGTPGQDQHPQPFETAEPLDARPEWNAVPVGDVPVLAVPVAADRLELAGPAPVVAGDRL